MKLISNKTIFLSAIWFFSVLLITAQETDTIKPIIEASSFKDKVISNNTTSTASLPDYTSFFTATDNVDANVSIVQNPVPGTIISGQSNLITISATDVAGNTGVFYFNVAVDFDSQPITESVNNKAYINNPTSSDFVGYSSDISGNYAIAGSPDKNDQGAAFIFKNNNGTWTQVAQLESSDIASGDDFGRAVAIYNDYAVVGAPYVEDMNSGAAYVFYNNGVSWNQVARLSAADSADIDWFGTSVDIYGDYIVVGANGKDITTYDEGAAYVFYNNAGTWEQVAKLTTSDGNKNDFFGERVSIFEDYILVGTGTNATSYLKNSGCGYVFRKPASGWKDMTETSKLCSGTGLNSGFTKSVCISESYAVIGTTEETYKGASSGAVHVFQKNGEEWIRQAKLIPSDGASRDYYGKSVGVSGDYILVGSYSNDLTLNGNEGASYLYYNNNGKWEEKKIIPSVLEDGRNFGWSIAIDDNYAIIGAPSDNGGASDGGALYFLEVYDKNEINIVSYPSNKTLEADENCNAILPDYTVDVVLKGDESNFTITQSPDQGTLLSGGANIVTITIANMIGDSEQIAFNVEVPCSETGINNLSKNTVVVYPTLTEDILHISIENQSVAIVQITNTNGVLLQTLFNVNTIDISDYSKGFYNITVYCDNFSKTFTICKK